mgnify:FL=1
MEVFDAGKPWWQYTQVSELVQGRDSVMIGDVQKAAKEQETAAQKLIKDSNALSPEGFAARLRDNALHTSKRWQTLYGELLVKYNEGRNRKYAVETPTPQDISKY